MQFTRTMFIFAVMALAAAPRVWAEDFPVQIKDLAPVYDTQKDFVAGLRAWGKKQVASATADLDEAKQLAREKKMDDAKAKKESAQSKVKGVREAYDFGLKKYPNDATLHNSLGELLYDQFGENASALREWDLAISLDSKYAPPYNNLGLDQCHNGNYEMGLANLEKALDLDSKNPDFMFNLVQIYLVNFPQVEKIKKWKPKKIYEHAMKLSKEAASIEPSDYQLAEDYAMNFFAADNFKLDADWGDAAAAWQRARSVAARQDRVLLTWMNEARCWIRANKPDEAKACLEEVLKISPESGPAKQLLANLNNPAPEQPKDKGDSKSKHKKSKGK